jgi:uncharacterized membrane protein HdeD (DUF308 family)
MIQDNSTSGVLSIVSGTFAFISLTSWQPTLTFIASIIAIVSGIISIRKNTK